MQTNQTPRPNPKVSIYLYQAILHDPRSDDEFQPSCDTKGPKGTQVKPTYLANLKLSNLLFGNSIQRLPLQVITKQIK